MASNYRPKFHISPPQGRLNDPNGMFLDGNTLHVFYQHDPAFPFGQKRTGWGHVSADLQELRWTHHPDALYPDAAYDLHGCYSGGAARDDDGQIYLFYTGNLKVDGQRIPTQNLVQVSELNEGHGGVYRRSPKNPLIDGPAEGCTGHFRDPVVTRDAEGWRMVVGAQRTDETPGVALYRGDSLDAWEYQGLLEFDLSNARPGDSPDLLPQGYMWECPNLITLADAITGQRREVLIICPQGLQETVVDGVRHYASSDQCGYLVGRLEGTTFHVERGFSELDWGHQFYAPQVIAYGSDALMVGWMGLPAQDDTPTVAEGWVHTLTAPRQLTLVDGCLMQFFMLPRDTDELMYQKFAPDEFSVWTLEDASGAECARLELVGDNLHFTVGDDCRMMPAWPGDIEIYLDGCALEISFGGGRGAISAAVFPRG